MKIILRNIVAVVLGLVVGSVVNMSIIMISGKVIPLPDGVNPADMESLKAGMYLFEPKHFLMPFLAHALGALVGAFIAAKIAALRKLRCAMIIGVFFLFGGIEAVRMLPEAPMWFNVTDLVLAYIPMAFLGYKLAERK
ncbi:MAG TPA: hypothetical protein VGB95_01760 [Chitinophagales bacterium]